MSILKLKDSQGNWIGVPTIKGNTGNGIQSAVLNNDYTLTLTFTDGTTYTTPSIRGEKGEQGEPATDMDIHICSASEYDSETRIPTITSPDDKTFYLVPTEDGTSPDLFTEWVYVNNAWEMFGSAKIDLSGYLTDVTVDGTSVVTDGVAEIPIASNSVLGVVRSRVGDNGIQILGSGYLGTYVATDNDVKNGIHSYRPIAPNREHSATFYGLAKVAGHDEKDSTLPVGQYTDEAKASIRSMLGVPSEDDIPDVPVEDVQVNGTSIITDGVANVPIASNSVLGAVKAGGNYGVTADASGRLSLNRPTSTLCKQGTNQFIALMPFVQDASTFYGLAKAASDTTQSQSGNAVGQYTDNAKDKIQTMLGVSPLIAPHESDPFESAHVIGELFIINGKLYRAKTALTAGEYINEGTNVEVVDVAEVLDDTYVKNTDYAVDRGEGGIVKVNRSLGISVNLGVLGLAEVSSATVKGGNSQYYAISPRYQHESVFYGLAKASGDTTQSQSNNPVGTYTDEAKASIKSMLGVQDGMVVNATLVSGTQYTIDSTYDDIKTALSAGKTVVVMTQGVPQPFVGNVQLDGEWYLAFGVSTIYDNIATLTGFMIPQTYQNVAIWTQQNTTIPQLTDVQINGTSIVADGVAEIPVGGSNIVGAYSISESGRYGLTKNNTELRILPADDGLIKNPFGFQASDTRPIPPKKQHNAVFYGLAKAAGDTTQSASSNAVGTYTDEAKTAIKQMLGVHDAYDSFVEEVTGTDVTITGQPSYRYNCGELYSLTVTPPSSGTIDFRFTSGSTPTVLTLPSTVKMPEWWVEVEANTIYEMCITDGIYCGVMTWAV